MRKFISSSAISISTRFSRTHPVVKAMDLHITPQSIQGVIKKFRDLASENYNLLLMAKNI